MFINSDVNSNNILLSNLDASLSTVKLEDLNNDRLLRIYGLRDAQNYSPFKKAFFEDVAKNNPGAQTHKTRALEVWPGFGIF
jgi:hypothetical protein